MSNSDHIDHRRLLINNITPPEEHRGVLDEEDTADEEPEHEFFNPDADRMANLLLDLIEAADRLAEFRRRRR